MKKYIKVTATFDCDGNLLPEYIYWNDDKKYAIDRITDIRYTCRILGRERYLYLEENRWFVDAKEG